MLRDLAVLAVVYGTLPFIPFRPFLGLMVFSWLAFMRPQDMAWTLSSTHFSQYVAIAMLIGMLLKFRSERFVTIRGQTVFLIVLWLWVSITRLAAVSPEVAEERYLLFSKIVLIALITTGLVSNRKRFRLLFLVTAFSLGLLGLKYGLYGLKRGGSEFVSGPGGFMGDRNALAMGLAMGIPLLVAVAVSERSKLLRVAAGVCAMLSSIAVVFTFSRTGFVALALVAVLLVLRSGRRILAILLIIASFFLFDYYVEAEFKHQYEQRIESIEHYEQDASAMGRIRAWHTAFRIFRDYPITGVGPDNLQVVYDRYSRMEDYKVSHNSFLQFLVECGLPAVVLFVLMMLYAMWRMQIRIAQTDDKWVKAAAQMLQISILAYIAGSMFLDRAYYDLIYHLIALTVGLENAVEAEESSAAEFQTTEPPQVESSRRSEEKWWKQAPAPTS